MTRRFGMVVALLIATPVLAGCSALEPEPTPTSSSELESSATAPLMDVPSGDANWECGHVSALLGIQFRSEWELENGVIDQDAFDARAAGLVDAWTQLPQGQSDVSPALQEASAAAPDGIGRENVAFARAIDVLGSACDAARSVIIIGTLPEMGG